MILSNFQNEVVFSKLMKSPTINGIYKSKKYQGTGTKILKMGQLFANSQIFPKKMKFDLIELTNAEEQKLLLENEDLLFSRTSVVAEGVGKCSIVFIDGDKLIPDSNTIRVRLNKKIAIPLFYYYYFSSPQGRASVKSLSSGSAVTTITGTGLRKLSVPNPSLNIQLSVAGILYVFDRLVENNIRRIQVLEEMAQLIYREWFLRYRFPANENVKMVDSGTEFGEIPEGWGLSDTLDNPLFVFNREKIDKYEGTKDYYATAVINGSEIVSEGIPYTYENKPSRAQKQPGLHSMWFARMQDTYKILPITGVNLDWAENSMISSGFAGFTALEEYVFPYLYCLIASKEFHAEKDRFCTGATQRSLTDRGLSAIKILVPPREVLSQFSDIVFPMINLLIQLQKINKNLRITRDFLLPKLISGEIDIDELDIELR